MGFGIVNVPGAALTPVHQSIGVTGTSTTAAVFSGSGIELAAPGDTCINPSTGNVYKCTVGGAPSAAKWVYTGCIKGPQGAAGSTGPQGAAGLQGPAGPGIAAGGTAGQLLAKESADDYSTEWVDPVGKSLAGQTVSPTSDTTVTAGTGAEIFNDYRSRSFESEISGNVASGTYSHAEGWATTASGNASHAEGCGTTASGYYSHAEGWATTASGYYSHAEGQEGIASEWSSHCEGDNCKASGRSAHAEGHYCTASGTYSHAEGDVCIAVGYGDHVGGSHSKTENYGGQAFAHGYYVTAAAKCQTVFGRCNVVYQGYNAGSNSNAYFIIGDGGNENTRSNCFRVGSTGVWGAGNYNSTGADYAELFEWTDDNPNSEDRIGRFVTLEGEKIRLAKPEDSFILGIISGAPSVVGDVYDDQWQGMYLCDIYGRPLWEDVEVPEETMEMPDPDNPEQTIVQVISPAHTERRQKVNPNYDSTQTYIPRSERPEWGCVGLMGKLTVIADGSCQVNGWCTVGEGGVATASNERTDFRVLSRLDDTHVRVLILGRR